MFKKGKKAAVLPRLTVTSAKVCVCCETLFSTRGACPSCGSAVSMPLSRWVTPMVGMIKSQPLFQGVCNG